MCAVALVVYASSLGACSKKNPGDTQASETASVRSSRQADAPEADLREVIRQAEARAVQRDAERAACVGQVTVYDGSIAVDASDHVHRVVDGDDYVEVPIPELDRVLSKAPRLRFTLDYPFEKPYRGVVTGQLTLRRTIDAIRAGFRELYEGTTERDIPGMINKDVTGPYGRAFHTIGDLVIERIDVCGDGTLAISIGS